MRMLTFVPFPGATQSIAATGEIINIPAHAEDLLLTLVGGATMFVRVTSGTDTTVATAADCPVVPGAVMVIGKSGIVSRNMTRLAVSAPGGGTLYVTPGYGA